MSFFLFYVYIIDLLERKSERKRKTLIEIENKIESFILNVLVLMSSQFIWFLFINLHFVCCFQMFSVFRDESIGLYVINHVICYNILFFCQTFFCSYYLLVSNIIYISKHKLQTNVIMFWKMIICFLSLFCLLFIYFLEFLGNNSLKKYIMIL